MLRSFAKAKEYIYIDPSKMKETKEWLRKKQRDNGCFEMVGAFFNRRMKVSRLADQKRLQIRDTRHQRNQALLLLYRVACLKKSPSLLTSPPASWR